MSVIDAGRLTGTIQVPAQHQEQIGISLQGIVNSASLGVKLLPLQQVMRYHDRPFGWVGCQNAVRPDQHRIGSAGHAGVIFDEQHDEIHPAGSEGGIGVVIIARAVRRPP